MGAVAPLKATLKQERDRFILSYSGYIAENDVAVLHDLEARIMQRPRTSTILFVQSDGFAGFHRSQVSKHAQALLRMKNKLHGVAIANATGPVRFAIASVSMLTKVPLKGFESVDQANRWLDDLTLKATGDLY